MKSVGLVLVKDVRTLLRTPALLGVLLAYPLVIAALVGLVAGYASSKPRVAFVDRDGLPPRIAVGSRSFDVRRTIDEVARNVTLVRLTEGEAARQLADGKVVAVVTVPPGFVSTLEQMVQSPTLQLAVTSGGTSARVRQQVQALVYSLNRKLQRAYIDANLVYVKLILHGGNGHFLGRDFQVLGLDGTERELVALPQGERVRRIERFVRTARLALEQTGGALHATAAPIALVEEPQHGRSAVLSAQVQSYALGLTIAFLSLVLAAGALAAERDENVLGMFLGLIPREVFAAAGWISDGLPFAHSVRFFSAALYDLHPWGSVAREGGWMLGLGAAYAGAAVLAVRPFRP